MNQTWPSNVVVEVGDDSRLPDSSFHLPSPGKWWKGIFSFSLSLHFSFSFSLSLLSPFCFFFSVELSISFTLPLCVLPSFPLFSFLLTVIKLPLWLSGLNVPEFTESYSAPVSTNNCAWTVRRFKDDCSIRHRSGYVTPWWLDHARIFHNDDEGHRSCMVITLIVVKDSKAWSGWHGDDPIKRNTSTANYQCADGLG